MSNIHDRSETAHESIENDLQVDRSRRSLALTLFGTLGAGALLHGCVSDPGGSPESDALDRNPEISGRRQALDGTTNIRWFDTVASMRGFSSSVPSGAQYTALVHGYAAPGDGGGGMFVWSTTAAVDDGKPTTALYSGTIVNPLVGGVIDTAPAAGWRRVYSGPVNVLWFGAKGNRVGTGASATPGDVNYRGDDDSAAIQTALNFAGASGVFFPGNRRYRLVTSLTVNRDCELTTECHGTRVPAKLEYEGAGFALIVNSDAEHLSDSDVAFNVRHFEMHGLYITAPSGKGIKLGSTINPSVLLNNVTVEYCAGYAIELGGSVYFTTLRKCIIHATKGVLAREACDLFTVDQCAFYRNTNYDLDIASPTFQISNSDFEVNEGTTFDGSGVYQSGNKANIRLSTSAATSGYGTIRDCRFGPEGLATKVSPYDIEMMIGSGGPAMLRGVRLLNNKHFSAPSGTGLKAAPVLVDCGLGQCDISGAVQTNYGSGALLFATSNTGIVGSSAIGSNYVDDMATVPDALKPMFVQRADGDLKIVVMERGQPINALEVVSNENFEPALGPSGLMKAYRTILVADYVRHVVGITLDAGLGATRVAVAGHGSIITTTLDTSGSSINAPVYMGASNGVISLAPDTNFVRQVGRVASLSVNGRIIVDLSEPPRWAAMPSSGAWRAGDFARKSTCVVAGSGGSQYIVRGWNRLTTGSAHVLNTDWAEARELTGT